MKLLIVSLIYISFLYLSAQAFRCDSNNICGLGGYYTLSRGYQCIQDGINDVICTCPGGFERNMPCRPCNRSNSLQNVCRNTTGKLIACLETDQYGTSYVCLCSNGAGSPVATTNADCDPTAPLTSRPTTTTAAGSVVTPSPCLNGGVLVYGICNCPSGYGGAFCETLYVPDLCERIECKNGGACRVRGNRGVCACHTGTFGDYCELNGTLGFCSSSSCLNGAACVENVVGTTRHAYCRCPPGYNGVKCDNRYFSCPTVGKFDDIDSHKQGKYFDCTNVGGTIRIEQKSCPPGLRFNTNYQICTYSVQK